MEVNPFVIKWYFAFLTGRQQQVRVNSTLSRVKDINMGAPQGGVSSPIIFTLYTNSCKSKHSELYVIKFSDDTALLSLLYTHSDTTVYHTEVQRIVSGCDGHNLNLKCDKVKRDGL